MPVLFTMLSLMPGRVPGTLQRLNIYDLTDRVKNR